MVLARDCEARMGGTWKVISVEEALPLKGSVDMRCIECHGAVRPHGTGSAGTTDWHFEHFERNHGCPRSDAFDGKKAMHLHPLE